MKQGLEKEGMMREIMRERATGGIQTQGPLQRRPSASAVRCNVCLLMLSASAIRKDNAGVGGAKNQSALQSTKDSDVVI